MREIIEYLNGTWLSKASRPPLYDRGPIRGSTIPEVEAVELEIQKKLPLAMKAWYRVAGTVPPYLYDYDANYSFEDFKRAQVTAIELTQAENCDWHLNSSIIPFSQRLGEQFIFVDVRDGNPDDPAVYHYSEGEAQPRRVDVAFTTHIREVWLGWLDFPAWDEENSRQIRLGFKKE